MIHQKCIKNRNCIKQQIFTNTNSYLLVLRLEEKPNGDAKSRLSFLRFWSQFFHDGDNTYWGRRGVATQSPLRSTGPGALPEGGCGVHRAALLGAVLVQTKILEIIDENFG